jgi:hypothetical protein
MVHLKANDFLGVDLDSVLLSVQKDGDKSLLQSLVIFLNPQNVDTISIASS